MAPVIDVADGIWAVSMALPSEFGRASWTYLIDGGSSGLAVVDPGWNLDENWDALQHAFAHLGVSPADVALAYSTHAHRDHFGLSGRMRRTFGMRTVLQDDERSHVREQMTDTTTSRRRSLATWGVPTDVQAELSSPTSDVLAPEDAVIDVTLGHDDALPWDSPEWTILETPGHTSGSSCLINRERRIIFTGDHVLVGESPGLGLGGEFDRNPFDLMRESLTMVADLDGWTAFPGHGSPFSRIADEAETILRHHTVRRDQVATATSTSAVESSVWEIARRLPWRGGFENMSSRRLLLALHHVDVYSRSLMT